MAALGASGSGVQPPVRVDRGRSQGAQPGGVGQLAGRERPALVGERAAVVEQHVAGPLVQVQARARAGPTGAGP